MTLFHPTNGSADDITSDSLGRSNVQIGFEVFLASLICVISFIGNLLVVYAIHRDSRLNTVTKRSNWEFGFQRYSHGNAAYAILDRQPTLWTMGSWSRGMPDS